MLLRINLFT